MCLSTAYMNSGNEQKELMKDIARIDAEGQGVWLINLLELVSKPFQSFEKKDILRL